jgi:hypothetical protein
MAPVWPRRSWAPGPNRRSGPPDSGSPERWNGPHSEAAFGNAESLHIRTPERLRGTVI